MLKDNYETLNKEVMKIQNPLMISIKLLYRSSILDKTYG
jgi:hypothetical protein